MGAPNTQVSVDDAADGTVAQADGAATGATVPAAQAAGTEAAPADSADSASSAYASYRRRTFRRIAMLTGLTSLLLAVFLMALMVGPLGFSPVQVLGSIFYADYDPWVANIVINLRLPPALLAVLVGGALSLA